MTIYPLKYNFRRKRFFHGVPGKIKYMKKYNKKYARLTAVEPITTFALRGRPSLGHIGVEK
jgi:hypothetical protein